MKYQLRYAAGLYWLLDMEQAGASYTPPLPLNNGDAQIWKLFESGLSEEQVCEWLCEKYEISSKQAREDVCGFVMQLQAKNIDFGGTR